MKALWNGTVIARSDNTVVVEGNHYFPREDINADHFRPSTTQTFCPWKGTATYFDITVNGEVNADAAWTYEQPKEAAAAIRGHVAFWKGVEVSD